MVRKNIPERQEFNHWKDVDVATQWRWPHFSPEEIASRGDGKLVVIASSMDALERLRRRVGKPMILNSAYRSPAWNKKVGGAANSYHMVAKHNGKDVMAFDVSMLNHDPIQFMNDAKAEGFTGIGEYVGRNFVHIDMGVSRTWTGSDGKRFPRLPKPEENSTRFTPEPTVPTVKETILNKDLLVPVGTAVGTSGLGAAPAGNGPFAWAIGFALVVGVIGFAFWIFNRNRSTRG